ncbi:SDR family oxidoreductase [Nocardia vinacea]|uniref:SDR family oxidoreductase n=1 Tax=Nocardia vinacea TaxID=96468 RepID=A0ABZ1YU96_9NOCA|nr:SDR family oxidoreductase [Nocardia vinacea]
MRLQLEDKVAIVTGASRGIGRAIVDAYVGAGARVMMVSRKMPGLAVAAAAYPEGSVEVFAANAGSPEDAVACVERTLQRFGRLDILVNNAATNPYYGGAMDIGVSQFDKTIEVNQRGPLIWTQCAWRHALYGTGGVVVNIASVGAFRTAEGLAVYNMSKAALVHMTQQLAYELAPGVRVVGIAPGLVETSMASSLTDIDKRAAQLPLKRIGQPSDIANMALFLASDAASWLTGQTIVVDGGASLRPLSG